MVTFFESLSGGFSNLAGIALGTIFGIGGAIAGVAGGILGGGGNGVRVPQVRQPVGVRTSATGQTQPSVSAADRARRQRQRAAGAAGGGGGRQGTILTGPRGTVLGNQSLQSPRTILGL